jgi:two-component system chemotaxis response regulator CheB
MKNLPSLDRIGFAVMGCSAGGVETLSELLPALPKNFPIPLVIAIHLLSNSKSILADLYGPRCNIPVSEVEDKEPMLPGRIYFAPAGYHLLIERDHSFSLSVEEPVNYSRPSIDVLFESAAIAGGTQTLGILLTGSNHDGAAGLKAIHDRGGATIAQSPGTAAFSVMPQSALDLFQPNAVLSPQEIRAYLTGERNG